MGELGTVREEIATAPVLGLAALLDVDPASIPAGVVPPVWQWAHLLDHPAQSALGPDGHPAERPGAPTHAGPLRMFAGGRLRTHRELRTGVGATRLSSVGDAREKHGRSGRLVFVTERHDYLQDGELVATEEKDIVYRDPAPEGPRPDRVDTPVVVDPEAPSITLDVDETLLFRFSALTFNAHRIHYDLEWARREGYDGLVIHGPLQVLLLAELLRRDGPGLMGRELAFRLVRPAVGVQRLTAVPGEHGIEHGARVLDAQGRPTAVATLTPFAPTS